MNALFGQKCFNWNYHSIKSQRKSIACLFGQTIVDLILWNVDSQSRVFKLGSIVISRTIKCIDIKCIIVK